jgi:hypothetical protein
MGREVDLNKLRELIKNGQQKGNDASTLDSLRVYVNKGQLVLGEDAGDHDRKALTRIDTETPFAARFEDEERTVADKFPTDAELVVVEGIRGWLYHITCEMGTQYQFWTYYDDIDGYYKTKVLEPHIEEYWRDIHRGHIFVRTNTLCLDTRYDGGAPALEKAFARTVLWATGFSVAVKTGNFPFSI